MTIADKLRADPRIAQAKELVLEAVQEHQQALELNQKPPSAEYMALLEKAAQVRGGALFFPFIGSGMGRGALVEMADGSVKYDFICGIGATFSHLHPKMVEAGLKAAIDDTVMQGNLLQTREPIELMERFVQISGLDHCFLSTSGATACENALKLAFQKNFPRERLLAFEHCFMGRTCTLARITDKPAYREGLPHNIPVDYVPFGPRALEVLDKHLKRYPNEHAAMALELIQGEGGFNVGDPEWLIPLLKRLREHGIAVIIDEVQSFGRTSKPFVFQHFGLEEYADIVTFGKLTQVCGTLFRTEFKPRPGLISQTFTGSTSAIYAAGVVLDSFDGTFNMKIHDHFVSRLKKMKQVTGPFGCGLMIACTPFEGDRDRIIKFSRALFDAGVIAFMAGQDPTRMRFLVPPGGITLEDIDEATAIIERTLEIC